jgi:hypothetical protein
VINSDVVYSVLVASIGYEIFHRSSKLAADY